MGAAKAPGHPLQYQLAVSAFFVLAGVLKSPQQAQKSTHRCAAISVRVPAPQHGYNTQKPLPLQWFYTI
jgi:hypothetical protein